METVLTAPNLRASASISSTQSRARILCGYGQIDPDHTHVACASQHRAQTQRIDVERQIHPIHIERSKGGVCIAGEAVCLMGAPNTPQSLLSR